MERSARANVAVYRLEVVNRSSLREEGAKLWGRLEDDRGNGLCEGPEVGPSLAGVYGTVRPVWLEPSKRGEWVGVGGREGTKGAGPAGPCSQGEDSAFTLSPGRDLS